MELQRPDAEPRLPHERRLGFGRTALRALALGTTLLAAHGVAEYKADIDEVKAMLATTQPSITEYSAPTRPSFETEAIPRGVYETLSITERSYVDHLDSASHTAIVNVSGFGKRENTDPQRFLKGLDLLGYGWTLQYDSAGIDTTVIAREIVQKARTDDRGINRLAFYGDSMGTIVATKIAATITQLAPDMSIPFIILDSPAIDKTAVRERSMSDGYALLDGMHLPGAEYSRHLRVLAELYLRRKEIIDDPARFPAIHDAVHKQVFDNSDLPSNIFLAEQFQMIVNADAASDLTTIGEHSKHDPTTIFMIGATDESDDDVVDTPVAYELIKKWARAAGLPSVELTGIDHFAHGYQAASKEQIKEYTHIFKREVVPRFLVAPSDIPGSNLD